MIGLKTECYVSQLLVTIIDRRVSLYNYSVHSAQLAAIDVFAAYLVCWTSLEAPLSVHLQRETRDKWDVDSMEPLYLERSDIGENRSEQWENKMAVSVPSSHYATQATINDTIRQESKQKEAPKWHWGRSIHVKVTNLCLLSLNHEEFHIGRCFFLLSDIWTHTMSAFKTQFRFFVCK